MSRLKESQKIEDLLRVKELEQENLMKRKQMMHLYEPSIGTGEGGGITSFFHVD